MTTCLGCAVLFAPPRKKLQQKFCSQVCSRAQASERMRTLHQRHRVARAGWAAARVAARAVSVVGGPWLQLERGDCASCEASGVWLYAPLVSPESVVCARCAQHLVVAGLREGAA